MWHITFPAGQGGFGKAVCLCPNDEHCDNQHFLRAIRNVVRNEILTSLFNFIKALHSFIQSLAACLTKSRSTPTYSLRTDVLEFLSTLD